ncbi:unnamed protein product [Cladocopium goreaui]|uniref:Prostaglandin F synthase n=1 Tax=Cladocopium goreaui TaxID=2562237 RepID=A0A9P1GLM1_9DINO|nr:unnamed protein product [Cladocopium goreaui]
MGAALPATNVSGMVADGLGLDKRLCRQSYEDGSEYYGQFVKRQFHGQGRMRWNCGDGLVDEYNGFWENGKMHGQGVYKYCNGTRYQGEFKENLREGYGVLTFTDGSLYEGGWREDVPEGDGRVIYSNGEILNTTFRAGQQSMEKLESLVKESVPEAPPMALEFAAGSGIVNPALKDAPKTEAAQPAPPPPPPITGLTGDVALALEGARLPILALTNLPPPPPLRTAKAPLPVRPPTETVTSLKSEPTASPPSGSAD